MARPTLFTIPHLLILLASIVTEPTLTAAAARVGLSTETIRRWRRARAALMVPPEVRVPHPDGQGQWIDYGGLTFADALERALAQRRAWTLESHQVIIHAQGSLCVCGGPARPGHRVSYHPDSDTFTVEVFRPRRC